MLIERTQSHSRRGLTEKKIRERTGAGEEEKKKSIVGGRERGSDC